MKRVVALLVLVCLAAKPIAADVPVLPTPVVYVVPREEDIA